MAQVLARSAGRMDAALGGYKRRLITPLRGRVLELGPGAGANLQYFGPNVQWTGVEPNPYNHGLLEKEARRCGMPVTVRTGVAESLPDPPHAYDAVVATLVLCSVADPAKVLAEVQRVLKPGGVFVFLEHVAAPRGTRLRRVQDWSVPVWRLLADGCHPNRDTQHAIATAGFTDLDVERFEMPFPLVGPHIAGRAWTAGSATC